MAITYIAFIQCVIKNHWFPESLAPNYDPTKRNEYKSYDDDAEIDLVDISETRRYFKFKRNVKVHIVNNVFVYDSDFGDEIAIDESKQFHQNQRIDQ